jgi:hypothetical protein
MAARSVYPCGKIYFFLRLLGQFQNINTQIAGTTTASFWNWKSYTQIRYSTILTNVVLLREILHLNWKFLP